MAIGLDNALQIAKSSLFANQYRINVIGQNIANADNVNYSKKVVVAEASNPIREISPGSMGTGINVTEVKRLIDKFLEINISRNDSEVGNYEIANKYLDNIQNIFTDLKDNGLSEALNQFWNAWFDLSNNPSNYAERISLIEKSKNLTTTFHELFNDMEEQQKYINFDIENVVTKINDLSEKIAKLNQEIYSIEINSHNHANDLRDKRSEYVKELSKYIDIKFVEEDNKYVVFTANGRNLVNGTFSYQLKALANSNNNNFYDIYWKDTKGNMENITNLIQEGELKGLVTVRDEYIQSYKNNISKIANALMSELDKIHTDGAGLKLLTNVISDIGINDPDLSLNFAGLKSPIQSGTFKIVVYDSNGNATEHTINIGDPESTDPTTDQSNLTQIISQINSISHINASITSNGKLNISTDSGYSFAFADDNTGFLEAIGINNFFKGEKYSIIKSVNIMATGNATNADSIYYTGVYDKLSLTGHEYKITYDSATSSLTIKDMNTGETLTSDSYIQDVEDGHLTLKFDGIKFQIDSNSWSGDNTYEIKNIPSESVFDEDSISTDSYKINFSEGTSTITVMDIKKNITLSPSEFEVIDVDKDGDSNIDSKVIKIKAAGISVTVDANSYGEIEINPQIVGAKYITTKLDENSLDYINAGKIETSDSSYAHSVGDNRIALEIANLKDKKVLNNGNDTINDAYSDLIAEIGLHKNFIQNRLEAAKVSKEGLMKKRDNISGVSIDEEMTRLIQAQHAYIASAKIITVVDVLTQNLLSSVR